MKNGHRLVQRLSQIGFLLKKQFQTSKGRVSLAGFFVLAVIAFVSLAPYAQGLSRSGEIRITNANKENNYGSQSVIVLGPSEEPAVNISKYYNGLVLHKQLKVSLYRIDKEDLLKFLTYTKEKNQNGYENYNTKPFDIAGLEFVTELSYAGAAEQKVSLPISDTGLWLVRATMDDNSYNDAVILRSNIGGLIREGNNDLIVWQQSLRTGKSVGSGSIAVYNLENTPTTIGSANFDATGVARLPVNKAGDIALISSGNDLALLVLNLPSSYRYEDFGPDTISRKYYLFTDRPLYKPGDTVYFKAIVRNDNDATYTIPSGTAHVRVLRNYDTNEAVYERDIPISPEGTVSGSYVLPESSPTGFYQVEVATNQEIERTQWLRGLTTFYVEHYRKPEYSINVDTNTPEIIRGDKAQYTISGQYFFGQPISNQTVKYTVSSADFYESDYYLSPSSSTNLDDRYQYGYWGGQRIKEDSVVLDEKGMTSVELDTRNLPALSDGKDHVLVFEASYIDESGNPSVTKKNVLVHAGEYSVYRSSYRYGSRVGEPISLPLKLLANSNASVSGVQLSVEPRRHWWTRKINPDRKPGKYSPLFVYEDHTESLKNFTVTSNANGEAVINFVPNNPGSHIFKVSYIDSRGNRVEREFSIWVVSENELVYDNQYQKKISLTADKKEYKPGEVAQFTITSEVSDRDVFVSLERDGVHRYQIAVLKGKSAQVAVPIISTDIPNIIVTASSFSGESFDYNTQDLTVSADSKKVAVALKLREDVTKYAPGEKVTLDLTTTDVNGNPLSADVAVWTVDKSLYELMNEVRQPIFDAFWYRRYNSTSFAHSFEGISSNGAEKGCFVGDTLVLTPNGSVPIKDLKVGDTVLTKESNDSSTLVRAKIKAVHETTVPGYLILNHDLKVTPEHVLWVNDKWTVAGDIQIGDKVTTSKGEELAIGSIEWQRGVTPVYNLEIERYHTYFAGNIWVHNDKGDGESRTLFKDTAYWNPSVRTDVNGRASVTFTLPDNLTTWVMNAVAVTNLTQVGETRTEIVVTKPVIVRPALPNFLRAGDTFELASIAHNFTDSPGNFLASFNFTAFGSSTQAFDLPIRGLKNLLWKVTPTTPDPAATVNVSVEKQGSGERDSVTVPLPVEEFGFFEKYAKVGRDSAMFPLALSEGASPTKSKATLSLASSFLGTLPTAMEYLVNYPYGCIEQTTSRFIPAVLAKEHSDLFGSFIQRNDLDEMVEKGIERLTDLAQPGGGWTWWQWGEINPFVTAYATEYLVRARSLGYDVDAAILNRTKQRFEYEIDKETDPSIRIAKIYTLSLLGSDKGKVMLTDFRNVTPDILSLAIISNIRNGYTDNSKNGVNELINKAERSENTIHWTAGHSEFFPSVEASTALALRALTLAGEKDEAEQAARYLYQNRPREYWRNSFATAQVIEALTDFSKIYSGTTPNVDYQVRLGDKDIAQGKINSLTQEITISIPITSITSGSQQLSIGKSGQGELYSTLVVDEFKTNREPKPVADNLKMERNYKGDFLVGQTVEVRLKVSGLPAGSRYLVIEDVLPAGLVPINPMFKNEYSSTNDFYGNYYDGRDYPSAQEITKEGMITSFDYVDDGIVEFTYKARVISRGVYNTPPATAFLMYDPDVYGRTGATKVTIDDNPRTAAVEGSSSSSNGSNILIAIVVIFAAAGAFIGVRRYKQKQQITPPNLPQ